MRQKNQTRYLKAVPRQQQHSQSIWCSLQQQDGSKENAVNIRNHYWNKGQLQDFGSKNRTNNTQNHIPPPFLLREGFLCSSDPPAAPRLHWAGGSAFMVLPAGLSQTLCRVEMALD